PPAPDPLRHPQGQLGRRRGAGPLRGLPEPEGRLLPRRRRLLDAEPVVLRLPEPAADRPALRRRPPLRDAALQALPALQVGLPRLRRPPDPDRAMDGRPDPVLPGLLRGPGGSGVRRLAVG